ncbi:MAG: hypothetical protein ACK4TB_13200 [Gemmobacter sp.]
MAVFLCLSTPASSATVTYGIVESQKAHLDYIIPGYLVGGRVRIETSDNWNTFSLGYAVSDNYRKLGRIEISVANGWGAYWPTVSYLSPIGKDLAPGRRITEYYLSMDEQARFLARFRPTVYSYHSDSYYWTTGDMFGSGLTFHIAQNVFGNEVFYFALIKITDRSETYVEADLWDTRLLTNVPSAPIPLPASGFVLAGAVGFLTALMRKRRIARRG